MLKLKIRIKSNMGQQIVALAKEPSIWLRVNVCVCLCVFPLVIANIQGKKKRKKWKYIGKRKPHISIQRKQQPKKGWWRRRRVIKLKVNAFNPSESIFKWFRIYSYQWLKYKHDVEIYLAHAKISNYSIVIN